MSTKTIHTTEKFNVSLTTSGRKNSYVRKVVTAGVTRYTIPHSITTDLLRDCEVRLQIDQFSDAIRLFPCVTPTSREYTPPR